MSEMCYYSPSTLEIKLYAICLWLSWLLCLPGAGSRSRPANQGSFKGNFGLGEQRAFTQRRRGREFSKNENVKERKMSGVRFLLGRRCYQVSVVELGHTWRPAWGRELGLPSDERSPASSWACLQGRWGGKVFEGSAGLLLHGLGFFKEPSWAGGLGMLSLC